MQYRLKRLKQKTLLKDSLPNLNQVKITPNLVEFGEKVAVDIPACSAVVQSKALESKVRL